MLHVQDDGLKLRCQELEAKLHESSSESNRLRQVISEFVAAHTCQVQPGTSDVMAVGRSLHSWDMELPVLFTDRVLQILQVPAKAQLIIRTVSHGSNRVSWGTRHTAIMQESCGKSDSAVAQKWDNALTSILSSAEEFKNETARYVRN